MGHPELLHANASYVTSRLLVGGDLDQRDVALARRQLAELGATGVTHLVDVRLEVDDEEFVATLDPSMGYLWHGMDDAGQRVPTQWFEDAVAWVLAVLEEPDTVVLTHCHMGINRGPSLGLAVLLAQGWDVVEAISAIRTARPVAHVAYAEDALRWHHERVGATEATRRRDRRRLARWRSAHPLDVVRIIATQRARGQ